MIQTPRTEWTALVGPREEPADGVRDYCHFLADALRRRGVEMAMSQVRWAERGWIRSLRELWNAAHGWKDRWVLLQYTPLAWSRRGFPFGAVAVAVTLRLRGARTAIMFHDWTGYTGPRAIDRLRWACQRWAMRRVASLAERSVLPVPSQMAPWLGGAGTRAVFIPIGANLPVPTAPEPANDRTDDTARGRVVGVFCVTAGEQGVREAREIGTVIRMVASRLPGLRLVVLGRGSQQSRPLLEEALDGVAVQLSVLGLQPAEDLARELGRADALVFVRGEILGHRGSAIAAVACGVPLVGYGDPERAFPVSQAGVLLAPSGDSEALAEALTRVLTDRKLRLDLLDRNRRAQAEYFSWERIADRFVEALRGD